MGFVLIVLLIVVVGVVFFAFSMRKSGETIWQKSSEADDFLSSVLAYTTNCRISGGNLSIRELVRECGESPKESCRNTQETVCEAANSTLNKILSELNANITDRQIHGYNLTVMREDLPLPITVMLGNQTGSSFISSLPISGKPPYYETMEISLKSWYSSKAE